MLLNPGEIRGMKGQFEVISTEEDQYNTTLYESSLTLTFSIDGVPSTLSSTLYNYGITSRQKQRQFQHFAAPFPRFFLFESAGGILEDGCGTEYFLRPGQRYIITSGHPFFITYLPGSLYYHAHFGVQDWTGQQLFRPGCRRPPRWQPLSSRRGFGCSGTNGLQNHRTLHERPLTRHGPMRASAPTKRAEQTAISNHRALREKPLRGTDARCAPLRKKSRLGCVDRGYYGGASAGRCGHRPLQRPRGRNASHNLRFGI